MTCASSSIWNIFAVGDKSYLENWGTATILGLIMDLSTTNLVWNGPISLPKINVPLIYVSKYVHGLPYYPGQDYHVASELLVDVRRLYQQFKTPQRTLVAHKGGMEGEWLDTWQIPRLDLERWGCPKFDDLPRLSVGSCGRHQRPLQLHCPQVECYHFVQWMRSQRLLSYDTRYINHERTQRMLASQTPRTPLRPAHWKTFLHPS